MSSINEITKYLFKKRMNEARDYTEMDRDELIKLAQAGDQYAFDAIVDTHRDFLRKMTSKYFTTSNDRDRDDLIQMATIALWKAVESYDADSNGDFEAYAGMIIKRQLTDEIRKESAGKVAINTQAVSLDKDRYDPEGDPNKGETGRVETGDVVASKFLTPEEEVLGEEGARELMQFMKDNFSAKERDVVMRYIDGMSIQEIADAMEIKYKSVENTLMRLRGKLNNYIKSSYKESEDLDESEGVHFTEKERLALKSILDQM